MVPSKKEMSPIKELTLGIDEAGRGPILGPMVMACVGLSKEASDFLSANGVMDSKKFGTGVKAHERRMALVPLIQKWSHYMYVMVIDVSEIDRHTIKGELNKLEQEKAKEMIRLAPKAHRIIADGFRLFQSLQTSYPELEAWDHGESVHVAVAAASILAKTRRDEEWNQIVHKYQEEFGDLIGPGGGYSNADTKRFLRAYCTKYRTLPPEGRRSWPWDFVSDLLEPSEYQSLVRQMLLPSIYN